MVRENLKKVLEGNDRIFLAEPLAYDQLVAVLKCCKLVITDSGGLQEEAPTFGKPVLVVRNNTERLEAINAGCQIIAANVGGISENKSNLIKLLNNDDYKEWIKEILISKPLTLNSRRKLIYFSKDQANLDYYISRIEKNVGK